MSAEEDSVSFLFIHKADEKPQLCHYVPPSKRMTGRLSSLKTFDDTVFGSRREDSSTEDVIERGLVPMHCCIREESLDGATRAKQPL